MNDGVRIPTGHVFRVERARGPVWYCKYRLADGRQVQRKLGPAWVDRGRPPTGYFTKRIAEAWLRDVLDEARRGTLPGMVRSGATFADAAAEWLRYVEQDRGRKPSTLRDYKSVLNAHLLPAFGTMLIEAITPDVIERWRRTSLDGLSNRTKNKLLISLHGIFRRAQTMYGSGTNPLSRVEKHPQQSSGDVMVFSPEEVWALVRAAPSEADAALFLTAAFTGLRMGELLALRWRDVDFTGATIRVRASYASGILTTPKSGQCPRGADGARRCVGDRCARRARALDRPTTISCSSVRPEGISTVRRCAGGIRPRWCERICARCVSTIYATRSEPG